MNYDLQTLRGDVLGGITSAVVLLPMALAYGVVSGLGVIAGLYGAVAVGLFASLFWGTKALISGPTGPMAVAMAVVVGTYAENIIEAFTIVIVAGVIQILLGLIKMGRYVAYTPYSVISGFTSGVGVIIVLLQVLPFLGAPSPGGGTVGAIRAMPEAVGSVNFHALAIALVTLVVTVAWPTKLARALPPTLAALIVGTLMGVLWLKDAPLIGTVPTGFPDIIDTHTVLQHAIGSFQPALVLALLASINTLLMSLIADSLTRGTHNPNRELMGQGVGNIVSGLFGGMPGAGNIPATVVNARIGGRTPVSGVLCALVLMSLVLGLGEYVGEIPHAVLAGILMKVGWDIIDWRFITRIHRVQREHLVVMVITLGLTVFADLLSAIMLGLIVAALVSARQFEYLELDSVISAPLLDISFLADEEGEEDADEPDLDGMLALLGDDDEDDDGGSDPLDSMLALLGDDEEDEDAFDPFSARCGLVSFRGSFTVASSNRMFSTISVDIRDHEVVILDFSQTDYMDDSAAFVVERLVDVAIEEDTECIVMGLGGAVGAGLQKLNILSSVPKDRYVQDMDEAKVIAKRILGI
ncbi:MAG: SulP family inorganic anion transporter [Acidimicrobiia bacterium]|nr:SulP family inorganic anion transporter [bacterium]MXX46582.1 SulP family inorganic anion transporter [Acidimicrobiia bacterium]MXY73788.1 SulP family inorganic anion transporter [Acidimicrobiia bacterium]MYD41723.1 SulP family inorganic anion transporter [Acidimicrobiia bacterium]MYG93164.1 SulP family inorganic anion transporter [Acidimicrobiia bacterium]